MTLYVSASFDGYPDKYDFLIFRHTKGTYLKSSYKTSFGFEQTHMFSNLPREPQQHLHSNGRMVVIVDIIVPHSSIPY